MKKLIPCLIIGLLLAAPVLSETSVWIAKTDSSVLYIGGTIHLLRTTDLPTSCYFSFRQRAKRAP